MPSTRIEEASSSELIKVFFYGTLKRSQPNHEQTLKNRAKFVSEAVTVDKWPLIIGTNLNIPFLLNKPGYGKNVHGEIYLIDQEAKVFFDDFEGVHDNLYKCIKINVFDTKSGNTHEAFVYVLNEFKPEILNEKTILFENYSSVNPYYGEYRKADDRPENYENLIDQLK